MFANEDACGTCTITITDGCTTIIGYVRATVGTWVLRAAVDTCQRDFFDSLGIFGCSRYYYPQEIAIDGDFGRYWLCTSSADWGNETVISDSRNSWSCVLRGAELGAPAIINYFHKSFPGIPIPLLRSFADGTCAGDTAAGDRVMYWYSVDPFLIYEWVCP